VRRISWRTILCWKRRPISSARCATPASSETTSHECLSRPTCQAVTNCWAIQPASATWLQECFHTGDISHTQTCFCIPDHLCKWDSSLWAWERFLAEYHKRHLNLSNFVLLYFCVICFSELYLFCVFFCTVFVCQYQSSDWLWRPPWGYRGGSPTAVQA